MNERFFHRILQFTRNSHSDEDAYDAVSRVRFHVPFGSHSIFQKWYEKKNLSKYKRKGIYTLEFSTFEIYAKTLTTRATATATAQYKEYLYVPCSHAIAL